MMSENKVDIIKNCIIKLPLLALFVLALYLSSGLTRLVMAMMLLGSIVCLFLKDKYKKIAMLMVVVMFIPLGLYANLRGNEDLFFYHTTNQSLYQPEFYTQQIFPDTYIRELIKDKTVIIPYEVKVYDDYMELDEDARGVDFKNIYFRENNFARYFKEYSKSYEIDETLPKVRDVQVEGFVDKSDFTNFGCANDMLRYSFLLNKEKEKEMSYFWYSWFYYTFSVEKEWYAYAYINTDGIETSDRLVALWDRRENLYIMSEEYYEEKLKK